MSAVPTPRRKPGRQPLPPDQVRGRYVGVRLTAAEREQLDQYAARQGAAVSELIRDVVFGLVREAETGGATDGAELIAA